MISEERTKEVFNSLILHFTSDYNYFKYGGSLKYQSKAPTPYQFKNISTRLITEDKVRNFFVSNIVNEYSNNGYVKKWISDYYHRDSFDVYSEWVKKVSDIDTLVLEDLNKVEDLKKSFKISGNHPELFKKILVNDVSLETGALLLQALPQINKYWTENGVDKVILPSYTSFLSKYSPFLPKKGTSQIIMNKVNNIQ